ncbi:hypothetical protein KAU43_03680 [candidate division WOR-3 bacterium]|nr:hypothetical protein [candidate division WOR-3 bacterium]
MVKKDKERPADKEMYICMDHEPRGWVFSSKKDDPSCPLCKHSHYVSCYSGDRKPSRKGKDNHEER